MAHAACKWILNQGVQAVAAATNEKLAAFDQYAVEAMIDLDLAYLTAKHLIQSGDGKTAHLAAKFNADVTARAMLAAADRVEELSE